MLRLFKNSVVEVAYSYNNGDKRYPISFSCINKHSRITGNDYIVRNIMRDDRTGSNNHTVADGNTRTDDHSSAQPAVIADTNRQACFYGLAAF